MVFNQNQKGYLGNKNLKSTGEQIQYSPEMIQEYKKCMLDPIYFIETYVKIVTIDHGLQLFKLYPYQKEFIKTFIANRYTISKMPRQCGKTTTLAGFFLWYTLFHPTVSVALLADKESKAKELLYRYKLAYEHLPKFLQQGIKEWNKKSIELENGSRIMAEATGSASVNGFTFNMVFLDEFAHVRFNVQNEFLENTLPVIASGETSKLIINSTPNGMERFYKIWEHAEEQGFAKIGITWRDVPKYANDPSFEKSQKSKLGEEGFAKNYECDFTVSSNTLISASKMKTLSYMIPISVNIEKTLFVYEKPKKDRIYFMIVDMSENVEQDYSTCSIMDITEIPYKQVCVFRSNKMDIHIFADTLYNLVKEYNDCYILVETASKGNEVANDLYNDFQVENLLMVVNKAFKGQFISSGFQHGARFGVHTSKQVKSIGCATLKSFVENDKLIINDFETISELSTFCKKSKSYEAEDGRHDDLVMTLVLFAWATKQQYFLEMTDLNVRTSMKNQIDQYLEEQVSLLFVDNGIDPIGNEINPFIN